MTAEHLYVHVPFCRSICYYCDFCHTVYSEKSADEWLSALKKELSMRAISPSCRTVYIGGGTPSVLASGQLNELLDLLVPYASEAAEYTVEINPETLDAEKTEIMKKHGVNRISMGLQTSSSRLLASIGRHHTFADVRHAVQLLRDAGIDNISLDLMYGLPQQTMEDLRQSCRDALSLQPRHLSLYSLTVEEKTVFGRKGVQPADPDTEADMYDWISSWLPQQGLIKYEISNFAVPGYESRHNTAYWEYRDFYGVSCGASGKEGGMRYDNERSLAAYIRNPLQRSEIQLSERDRQFEMVMMSLRMVKGMNLHRYADTFHEPYEKRFGTKTARLVSQGLLEITEDAVRATPYGLEILNTVLVELMDD